MNTFLPFNFVSQNIIYKQSLFRSFFFFLSFSTKRKIWKNNATRQTNQTCSSKTLPCSGQTLILFKRKRTKKETFFQLSKLYICISILISLNMVLIYTYVRNLFYTYSLHNCHSFLFPFKSLFFLLHICTYLIFSLSLFNLYPSPLFKDLWIKMLFIILYDHAFIMLSCLIDVCQFVFKAPKF